MMVANEGVLELCSQDAVLYLGWWGLLGDNDGSFVALLNQGLGLTSANEQFETYKLILYFDK